MSSFSIFDDIIKSRFPDCKMHMLRDPVADVIPGGKTGKNFNFVLYLQVEVPTGFTPPPACCGREKVYARRVIKIADLQPMADPKYNTVRK